MNRRTGALQFAARHAQPAERQPHVTHSAPQLLTEMEAAQVCRYFDRGCANPLRAFQKWARRVGVPVKVIGRRRHYERRVLEAFIDRQPWTRRHGEGR